MGCPTYLDYDRASAFVPDEVVFCLFVCCCCCFLGGGHFFTSVIIFPFLLEIAKQDYILRCGIFSLTSH